MPSRVSPPNRLDRTSLIIRSRWRWSCYPTNIQHRNCYQLYHAGHDLYVWGTNRQQARYQVGPCYRSLLFPYSRIILLLQQYVWEPVVPYPWWILYRYRKWMLVVSNASYPESLHELTVSVAEAGSIMSLAPSGARGKYLALWIVARNVSIGS